jgi:glycerate kinase
LTGGDLPNLRDITFQLPRELRGVEIIAACDVGNPLLGPDGAAPVFGPQKGATPKQVQALETGLRRLVERTHREALSDLPGAGAAGGLGFALVALFDAALRPGIEIVMESTNLKQRLAGSDLCFTGEGKLDSQSLAGKTVIGVASLCRQAGVPCIAIAGAVDLEPEAAHQAGLTACFSICPGPMSLDESMKTASAHVAGTTQSIVSVLAAGRR